MESAKSHIQNIIQLTLDNYPDGEPDEVEFTLTDIHGSSESHPWNLGIAKFGSLLKDMVRHTGIKPVEQLLLTVCPNDMTNTRVRISNVDVLKRFCMTDAVLPEDNGVMFEHKERLKKVDTSYGLRIRYATEKSLDDPDERESLISAVSRKGVKAKTYRHAKRYSLISPKQFNNGKGSLRADFTVVKSGVGSDFRSAKVVGVTSDQTPELYEVEVELTGITREDLETYELKEELENFLLPIMLNMYGGITLDKSDVLLKSLNNYVKMCRDTFPKLPETDVSDLHQQTMSKLFSYYIATNINTIDRMVLKSKKMSEKKYMFTDKADGERALMYVDDNNVCYLLTKDTVKLLTLNRKSRFRISNLQADKFPSNLLMIQPTGLVLKDSIKLIKKKESVQKVVTSFRNSLLDGEFLGINQDNYLENKYYYKTFDIIIHNNKNVSDMDFKDRLNIFNLINADNDRFNVSPKSFGKYEGDLKEFSNYVNTLTLKYETGSELTDIQYNSNGVIFNLDGLIFQPSVGPESHYPQPTGRVTTWMSTYKWKPSYMLTVDLRLTYRGKRDDNIVAIDNKCYDGSGPVDIRHNYIKFNAISGQSDLSDYHCLAKIIDGQPRTERNEPILKDQIVECRLSMNGGSHWVPMRVRYDKSRPNSTMVYRHALTSLTEEPISLDNLMMIGGGFGGYHESVITKVNRSISNGAIYEALVNIKGDAVILDIASGNAKSAAAWKRTAISWDQRKSITVLGIDLNDLRKAHSIMSSSYNMDKDQNLYVTYDFKIADFLRPLHYQESVMNELRNSEQFSTVSCVFAIHYAMKSEGDFRMFLANVSRNLRPEGLFIGSYMNRRKVLEVLKSKNKVERKLGPDILWSIEKRASTPGLFNDNEISVKFAALYEKPVQEYLIDLEDPNVAKICEEYGLSLIKHEHFNDMNVIAKQPKHIKDMYKDATESELSWLDLHFNFAFKKAPKSKSNPYNYSEMFKNIEEVDVDVDGSGDVKLQTIKSRPLGAGTRVKLGAIKIKPGFNKK